MSVLRAIVFSLASLIAMPVIISAQYLNRIYDYNNSSDWGYSVFVENSGNYFVFGSGRKGTWHLMAQQIDPNGLNLLNKRVLSSNTYDHYRGNPGAIRAVGSGGYVVPVTLSRPFGASLINFAALASIGANGDSLWLKIVTDTMQWNNEYANDCNLMPGGGFIVASRKGDIVNADAILHRTDNVGNVIWTRTHPTDGFITCEYIGDGKILVGGMKTQQKNIGPTFTYFPSQPRFLIYDTLGNLLQDTLYSTRYGGGGKIFKDKRGGYVHWGLLDTLLYPNNPDDVNNFPEYVAHLDDSFRITWIKSFPYPLDKRYIWNVKQLRDSNYLVLGLRGDVNSLPLPVGQGWAMKLDKNCNLPIFRTGCNYTN